MFGWQYDRNINFQFNAFENQINSRGVLDIQNISSAVLLVVPDIHASSSKVIRQKYPRPVYKNISKNFQSNNKKNPMEFIQ